MGQPIAVTEKPSSNPGVTRFETNRAFTGMGHERYLPDTEIWGERPPDQLARRLFEHASVAGVQINGNIVTVDLAKGYDSTGLKELIENLYVFYPGQPVVPEAESAGEVAVEAESTEGATEGETTGGEVPAVETSDVVATADTGGGKSTVEPEVAEPDTTEPAAAEADGSKTD